MPTTLPNLRILVVDDNETDRTIVYSMLQNLNVAMVHTAENGAIADGKLKTAVDISKPYHFVILDWNMPRTSGSKLLQVIRSNNHLKSTKVVIMTATSKRDVVEEAIQFGADDFIVKPVEMALLQQKLEKLATNIKF